MKPINVIFLIWITLFVNNQYGQIGTFCATPLTKPYFVSSGSNKVSSNNSYVIRIFVHIVRRSNGSGGLTLNEVNAALNILKSDFEPHNICFSLLGIDEIHDDYYSNFLSSVKFKQLIKINNHSNAIDIYLLGYDTHWQRWDGQILSGAGVAEGVPGKALAVCGNGNDYNSPNTTLAVSRVLSHEIGHCLGLYHTYRGPCEWSNACPEDPNGSNCSYCGDLVCDTPADNTVFNLDNNCNIDPSKAPCYDTYPYPSPTNLIMDYIPPKCMELFTPGQASRMHLLIQAHYLLQPVKVPDNLTLNPLTVNNGETKLYDVTNKLEAYNLTVNPGASLTLRAGKEIIIGPNTHIKTGSSFRAYIDTVCSTIDAYNSARVEQVKTKPKETGLQQEILVYPNPTSRLLYIETSYELAYEIYNVLGNKIKEGIASAGKNKINVSDLSAGVYVVKFNSGKIFKFVKIE